MMMKRLILIIALAIATQPAIAPACPMCKDSIGSGESVDATSVPNGFNASIYLMLGTFISTLGICGCVIAKACRTPTKQ